MPNVAERWGILRQYVPEVGPYGFLGIRGVRLFPLDVVDWFPLPDPELRSDSDASALSPREWLLSCRATETVARLARDLTRARRR